MSHKNKKDQFGLAIKPKILPKKMKFSIKDVFSKCDLFCSDNCRSAKFKVLLSHFGAKSWEEYLIY